MVDLYRERMRHHLYAAHNLQTHENNKEDLEGREGISIVFCLTSQSHNPASWAQKAAER
jgi:hypothetical protein